MWRALKMTLGIPLIAGFTIVQALLTFLCFLGSFVTTILALLMYFTLGMILIFQLQPVIEIVWMSIVATGIFLSPMIIAGIVALVIHIKELIASWIL